MGILDIRDTLLQANMETQVVPFNKDCNLYRVSMLASGSLITHISPRFLLQFLCWVPQIKSQKRLGFGPTQEFEVQSFICKYSDCPGQYSGANPIILRIVDTDVRQLH